MPLRTSREGLIGDRAVREPTGERGVAGKTHATRRMPYGSGCRSGSEKGSKPTLSKDSDSAWGSNDPSEGCWQPVGQPDQEARSVSDGNAGHEPSCMSSRHPIRKPGAPATGMRRAGSTAPRHRHNVLLQTLPVVWVGGAHAPSPDDRFGPPGLRSLPVRCASPSWRDGHAGTARPRSGSTSDLGCRVARLPCGRRNAVSMPSRQHSGSSACRLQVSAAVSAFCPSAPSPAQAPDRRSPQSPAACYRCPGTTANEANPVPAGTASRCRRRYQPTPARRTLPLALVGAFPGQSATSDDSQSRREPPLFSSVWHPSSTSPAGTVRHRCTAHRALKIS